MGKDGPTTEEIQMCDISLTDDRNTLVSSRSLPKTSQTFGSLKGQAVDQDVRNLALLGEKQTLKVRRLFALLLGLKAWH